MPTTTTTTTTTRKKPEPKTQPVLDGVEIPLHVLNKSYKEVTAKIKAQESK